MLASQPTLLGELWAKERLYLKGNFLRMTQVVLWLPHACTDMHVYPHTYITTHSHIHLSPALYPAPMISSTVPGGLAGEHDTTNTSEQS